MGIYLTFFVESQKETNFKFHESVPPKNQSAEETRQHFSLLYTNTLNLT